MKITPGTPIYQTRPTRRYVGDVVSDTLLDNMAADEATSLVSQGFQLAARPFHNVLIRLTDATFVFPSWGTTVRKVEMFSIDTVADENGVIIAAVGSRIPGTFVVREDRCCE